jgi:hypothetical protein
MIDQFKRKQISDSQFEVQKEYDSKVGPRRDFVKNAALAVPAIMTLRNGHAAAMVSSVQCFYNGPSEESEVMKDGDKVVYINVDANGQITYEGYNSDLGNPITPSCYSSFMFTAR